MERCSPVRKPSDNLRTAVSGYSDVTGIVGARDQGESKGIRGQEATA